MKTLMMTMAMVAAAGLIALRPATAQERGGSLSDVRDGAGLFGAGALDRARAELARVERDFGAPTIIETVDTLKGEPVEAAAKARARRAIEHGVYVLIARKESKIETLALRSFQKAIGPAQVESITRAFVGRFRTRKFDEGLADGVRAIDQALAAAKSEGKLPRVEALAAPRPSSSVPGAASSRVAAPSTTVSFGTTVSRDAALVVRDRVELTLEGAQVIIEAALAASQRLGIKENVAVVDDGGHLVAFARMNGARPASVATALTKAISAATMRVPSGPLAKGDAAPDVLLNVSLQNTAAAGGAKLSGLIGGLPIVVDGQVIGAVGVGGATGEQDLVAARAGVDAFLAALKASTAGKSASAGAIKKFEDENIKTPAVDSSKPADASAPRELKPVELDKKAADGSKTDF